MDVRWSADESYVVSVGGADRAAFQWRLVPHVVAEEPHKKKLVALDKEGKTWGHAELLG